ncbi:MAG TPA: efflux RND transporter periplasmic adaptor subunit [Lysobacter sp.]|nr:efflux RND transporter periplasmic adaptor subunit [Lysobacter sp.]
MKTSHWLTGLAVVVLALAAGWWSGRHFRSETPSQPAGNGAEQPRRILYYRNPMGLPDTSPVPKKDSMGMDYLPVYEGGEAPAAPGTVVLSPEKVQKLGVRTEAVRRQALSPSVRASATVQIDETRQYAIAPKFEGWVDQLHANQTGMSVRRGQPLLSVYSPELLAARNEFRVADAAARKLATGDAASAATMVRLRDAARQRLKNWGIDTAQPSNGTHGDAGSLVIRSPADAVLIEKPVVQGDRFAAGDTILRLADLSTVWLVANVPATSAGLVSVGQQARFQSPSLPGRSFEGRVGFIQPIIDPQTRTLAVRVALPNPDGSLRPGLFGDVVLSRDDAGEALTVARSAVLDSGVRQVVLVQVGEGSFEPRDVVLGERSGDRVEVREGLHEGERVVVSANFLIDAESNLQAALEALTASQAHDAGDTGPGSPIPAEIAAPDAHQHETPPASDPAADADASHDPHAMEH